MAARPAAPARAAPRELPGAAGTSVPAAHRAARDLRATPTAIDPPLVAGLTVPTDVQQDATPSVAQTAVPGTPGSMAGAPNAPGGSGASSFSAYLNAFALLSVSLHLLLSLLRATRRPPSPAYAPPVPPA
jgi:hypothetical protein